MCGGCLKVYVILYMWMLVIFVMHDTMGIDAFRVYYCINLGFRV